MIANTSNNLAGAYLFLVKREKNGVNRTQEYRYVLNSVSGAFGAFNDEFFESIPDEAPCIVANDLPNTNQDQFVSDLIKSIKLNPSRVYTYAGYRFKNLNDGAVSQAQPVCIYNRMPFTPRHLKNDYSDEEIDVMSHGVMACTCKILKKILASEPGGTNKDEARSVACSLLGIKIVCIVPSKDWSGLPRTSKPVDAIIRISNADHGTVFSFKEWRKPAKIKKSDFSVSKEDPCPVAVIITTHNRTETAKLTLESLVERLKYPDLHWIIADDRSEPGHLDTLIEYMRELGVASDRLHFTETTSEHWGLGASLNNALSVAFSFTDVVLTTEDDWYLQYDFDISKLVSAIKNTPDVGTIRLGAANYLANYLVESEIDGCSEISLRLYKADRGKIGRANSLQVALRHRRMFDALGAYAENKHPDVVESDMNKRFVAYEKLRLLWPSSFKTYSLVCKENPFVHFGESTVGHRYDRSYLVDSCRIKKKQEGTSPCLPVVFLTHNRTAVACTCLHGLMSNLEYSGRILFIVCDDMSDEGHVAALKKVAMDCGKLDSTVFLETSEKRHGLAVSMNNGIKYAFSLSDFVLTTEDDWLMSEKTKFDEYVHMIQKPDVAGIRFGEAKLGLISLNDSKYKDYYRVLEGKPDPASNNTCYVYNFQVMLRHRKVFDRLGFLDETTDPTTAERKYRDRFNSRLLHDDSMQILWPKKLKINTLNAGYFEHIGASTLGHSWFSVDNKWAQMNTRDADVLCMSSIANSKITELSFTPRRDFVYIADQSVFDQLRVSLFSLKKAAHAYRCRADVTILTNSPTDTLLDFVHKSSDSAFTVSVRTIPSDILSKCEQYNARTVRLKKACATTIALSKFEIPNILMDKDRVLFLDCDTLIVGNVFDIFNTRIDDGQYIAAVSDVGFISKRANPRISGPRHEKDYFNSGVMLMDLKSMRMDKIPDKLWEAKKNCKDQSLVDQNAFNSVFGAAVHVGMEYNTLILELLDYSTRYGEDKTVSGMNELYSVNLNGVEGRDSAYSNAKVLHFAGRGKPWQKNTGNESCKRWLDMCAECNSNDLRIYLVCIVRKENKYLREFVLHHLNIGFDKVIVYDNNLNYDENPGEVLEDLIHRGVVVIENERTDDYEYKPQTKAYTHAYRKYGCECDFIAFFDVDEYLMFKDKGDNVKFWVSRLNNNGCDAIRIKWKLYDDNDLLDVVDEDYSVVKRFTREVGPDAEDFWRNDECKSIVRTKLPYVTDVFDHGAHGIKTACDPNGMPCKPTSIVLKEPMHDPCAWLNHYRTMTIGEYVRKKIGLFKHDGINSFDRFFKLNKYTSEKEAYGKNLLATLQSK